MSVSFIKNDQVKTADKAIAYPHNPNRTQAMLKRCDHELTMLYKCAQDISATLDLTTVLTRLVSQTSDLIRADYSTVYLLDNKTQNLHPIAAYGNYADVIKSTHLQPGEGIVGLVAQQSIGEIVLHAEQDPRAFYIPGTPELAQTLACVPLIYAGNTIGVIAVARLGEKAPFVQADLDFLMRLAPQAAIAIEHARLYSSEQERAAELRRALQQQKELDQMKDQFIQNISHEFRTPLTIARGYAELLESEGVETFSQDDQAAIHIIARRLRMLGELVKDLNTLLNIENKDEDRATIDFATKVKHSITDYDLIAAETDIHINVAIEENCAPVWGDCIHLRRVLDNLVGNALKFTPEGGQINVAVKQAHETLILTVSDTGIGIPEDQCDRIFERFYQVEGGISRRYGGAGLGLSMVKAIVEAHGGHIEVRSKLGEGSTFIVKLPTIASLK